MKCNFVSFNKIDWKILFGILEYFCVNGGQLPIIGECKTQLETKVFLRDIINLNDFDQPLCDKLLVSVVKKKDRDPTILAVRNIHTRFSCLICEYPSTLILSTALSPKFVY